MKKLCKFLLFRFKEDGRIPRELLLALHSLLGEVLRYLNHCADPDPYVFGPPGSVSQRYGSGYFYHKAKIVRKTLNPTVL
jgi:hypothetical protein